jgi:hypothetical protein
MGGRSILVIKWSRLGYGSDDSVKEKTLKKWWIF